jgi:hypothetical protein
MKVTDEMTAAQIITLIQKLLDDVDALYSDCENISASLDLLRETDRSKALEAAETWAGTALGTLSDADHALKTTKDFLIKDFLNL